MSDPAILKLIEQLSLRISALEAEGYKFWIPVIISVVAIAVSLYTAARTKNTSEENMKQVTLQGIKSNVDSAKAQVESISMQIAPLKAKVTLTKEEQGELDIKNQTFDSVVERLLNAYNDGCQKYYKNQVVAQDFVDLYHQDIAEYIRAFEEKFTGPLTRFDAMLKYFNEKHKNVKA